MWTEKDKWGKKKVTGGVDTCVENTTINHENSKISSMHCKSLIWNFFIERVVEVLNCYICEVS